MQDLFDRLLAEGEAGILRLVTEGTQESVSLEFKTKENPAHGEFDKGDKRRFGEALSALANSQGGLLVWGVVARRDDREGLDCAVASKPIANIALFRSRAIELAGRILAPKHDSIWIESIASAEGDSAGYLLVLVERSERRPHRSLAPDDHKYYRRAGDSTFIMEHGDLEDAFNRRSTAHLSVKSYIFADKSKIHNTQTAQKLEKYDRYCINFSISNDFNVSALYSYIHFFLPTPPFYHTDI